MTEPAYWLTSLYSGRCANFLCRRPHEVGTRILFRPEQPRGLRCFCTECGAGHTGLPAPRYIHNGCSRTRIDPQAQLQMPFPAFPTSDRSALFVDCTTQEQRR